VVCPATRAQNIRGKGINMGQYSVCTVRMYMSVLQPREGELLPSVWDLSKLGGGTAKEWTNRRWLPRLYVQNNHEWL
jgi:hypothetical protein